jgi:hypothetical protein
LPAVFAEQFRAACRLFGCQLRDLGQGGTVLEGTLPRTTLRELSENWLQMVAKDYKRVGLDVFDFFGICCNEL